MADSRYTTSSGADLALRMRDIEPFHVMDLLARARQLEAAGRSIIHMEVGEPDFTTPQPIIDAGIEALRHGLTHYTPALGLPELRQAVADYYQRRGVTVAAERIVITPGASGALLLALGVLVDPGDQVLLADPGYPCNRHFIRMFEGDAVAIPVGPETDYQLDAALIRDNWRPRTIATLLATPSNPTGTVIPASALQEIFDFVHAQGGHALVDEIYLDLTYDTSAAGRGPQTALAISDDIFVINSFSKYFGMTGWRLGWLVVPEAYIDAVDRLAQNVFLAASTPAQWAALAAFEPETLAILEQRRLEFERRRDFLLPAMRQIGFEIPVVPQGAFYLYADCSRFTADSYGFARQLLEEAAVALTPGRDFGAYRAAEHVRFAYTTAIDKLEEGVDRLNKYINKE